MVSLILGSSSIVHIHPIARMLVMLVGFVGQFFPAILIPPFVSLQFYAKKKPQRDSIVVNAGQWWWHCAASKVAKG